MPRQRAFARLLPALLAGALAIAACADDPVARIRHTNVLLVTVDTLRADHVGAYGHPNPTTPTLDRLAAQGVRFADATVQWPKTWPSMASMLTGTFPATNGVRLRGRARLARRNETLAELLRAAGYRTAAVVSNLNVGKQFGFDQGFDSFVESWLEKLVRETNRTSFQNHPGAVKRYTDATIVTDQALAWLESVRPQERFFAWLHYMEPHGPYAPPRAHREPFEGRFRPESVPWSRIPAYQRQYHPETGLARGDLAYYKTLYDGEIRYFDSQLARVVEALERRGLFEHTLIVVTADHGESMGEHDYYLEHGKLPYQSTARVPLVMVLPGRLPAGRVVDAPVGLIDLAPTILELVDRRPPASMQGSSLMPLIRDGDAVTPRYVFMEAGYHEPTQLVVRRGRYKLVHFRAVEDRPRVEGAEFQLFDLAADPGELRSVVDEHPEIVAELKGALAEWLRTTPRAAAAKPEVELDAASRRLLNALGYTR